MPTLRTLTVELKTPTGESIEGASLDFRLLIDSSRKVAYDGTIGIWSVDDITVTTDADGMASVELYPSIMVKSKYVVRIRSDKYHTYDTFDMPDYDANLADILNLEAGDIIHPTLFKYFIDLEDTYSEHQLGWLKDDGQSVVLVTDLTQDDDFRSAVTTIAGSGNNNNNNDGGDNNNNNGGNVNNIKTISFDNDTRVLRIVLDNNQAFTATIPIISAEQLMGYISNIAAGLNALEDSSRLSYGAIQGTPSHLSDISQPEGEKLDSISADAEINVGTNLPEFRVKESHQTDPSELNILSILFNNADGDPVTSGDSSSIEKIYISSSVFDTDSNPLQLGVPPTFIPLMDHQNLLNDVVNHGGDLRVVFSELVIINEGEGVAGDVQIAGTFTIRVKTVSLDEHDNYILEDITHITSRGMNNSILGWQVSGTRVLDYASEGLVDTIDIDTQTHGNLPISRLDGDISNATLPKNWVRPPVRAKDSSPNSISDGQISFASSGGNRVVTGSTSQIATLYISKTLYDDQQLPLGDDTPEQTYHRSFLNNIVDNGGRILIKINRLEGNGYVSNTEFYIETKDITSDSDYYTFSDLTHITTDILNGPDRGREIVIEPTVLYGSDGLVGNLDIDIDDDTEGNLPVDRISGKFDIDDDTTGDLPASRISGNLPSDQISNKSQHWVRPPIRGFDVSSNQIGQTGGRIAFDDADGSQVASGDSHQIATIYLGYTMYSQGQNPLGFAIPRYDEHRSFLDDAVDRGGRVLVTLTKLENNGTLTDDKIVAEAEGVSAGDSAYKLDELTIVESIDMSGQSSGWEISVEPTVIYTSASLVDKFDIDDIDGDLPTSRISGKFDIEDDTEGDLPTSRISGNLPINRTSGDLPSSRVSGTFEIDDDTTGDLPISRVDGKFDIDIDDDTTGNLPASRVDGDLPHGSLPENWVRPPVRAQDADIDEVGSGKISFVDTVGLHRVYEDPPNHVLAIYMNHTLFDEYQNPLGSASPAYTGHRSFLDNIAENGGRIMLRFTMLDSDANLTSKQFYWEATSVTSANGQYTISGLTTTQRFEQLEDDDLHIPAEGSGWEIVIEPTTWYSSNTLLNEFNIEDDTYGNLPSSRVSETFYATTPPIRGILRSRDDDDDDFSGSVILWSTMPPPHTDEIVAIYDDESSNLVNSFVIPNKMYDETQNPLVQGTVSDYIGHNVFLGSLTEGDVVLFFVTKLDSSGYRTETRFVFEGVREEDFDNKTQFINIFNVEHVDLDEDDEGTTAWEISMILAPGYTSQGLLDKFDIEDDTEGSLPISRTEGNLPVSRVDGDIPHDQLPENWVRPAVRAQDENVDDVAHGNIGFVDTNNGRLSSGSSSHIASIYISRTLYDNEQNPLGSASPQNTDHRSFLDNIENNGGRILLHFTLLDDDADPTSTNFFVEAGSVTLVSGNYFVSSLDHATSITLPGEDEAWDITIESTVTYSASGLVDKFDIEDDTEGNLPASRIGDIPKSQISDFPDNTVPSTFRGVRRSAAELASASGYISFNGVTFSPHIGSTDQLDAIWINFAMYDNTQDPTDDDETPDYGDHVSFLRNAVEHGGRVIATFNKLDSEGDRTENEFIVHTDKVVESHQGYFDLEELAVIKSYGFGINVFSNDIWEVTIEPTVRYSSDGLLDQFDINDDTEGLLRTNRLQGLDHVSDTDENAFVRIDSDGHLDITSDVEASRVSGTFDINSKTTGNLPATRVVGLHGALPDVELIDETGGWFIGDPGDWVATNFPNGRIAFRDKDPDNITPTLANSSEIRTIHISANIMYSELELPGTDTASYTGYLPLMLFAEETHGRLLIKISELDSSGNDQDNYMWFICDSVTVSADGSFYNFIHLDQIVGLTDDPADSPIWKIEVSRTGNYAAKNLIDTFDIENDTHGDLPATRVSGLTTELPRNWVRPPLRVVGSTNDTISDGEIGFLGLFGDNLTSGKTKDVFAIELPAKVYGQIQTPGSESASPTEESHISFLDGVVERGGRIVIHLRRLNSSGNYISGAEAYIEADSVTGLGNARYRITALDHLERTDINSGAGWEFTIEPTFLTTAGNLLNEIDLAEQVTGLLHVNRIDGLDSVESPINNGDFVIVGDDGNLTTDDFDLSNAYKDEDDVPDTTGLFVDYDLVGSFNGERYIIVNIVFSSNYVYSKHIAITTIHNFTDPVTIGEAYDSTANASKRRLTFPNPTPDVDLIVVAQGSTEEHVAIAIEPSGLGISEIRIYSVGL